MLGTLKYIITAFVPGASLLLTQHYRLGLAIPFIGLLWVLLLSATRIVVTPTGFSALIAGLLVLHAVSFIIGINKVKKIKALIQPRAQNTEQKKL